MKNMIDCIMTDIPAVVRARVELGRRWRAAKLGDLVDRLQFRPIKGVVVSIYSGMVKAGAYVPMVTSQGGDTLTLTWTEDGRSARFNVAPDGVTFQSGANDKMSEPGSFDDIRVWWTYEELAQWLNGGVALPHA